MLTAFPHDKHSQYAGSDGEIDWYHDKAGFEGILPLQHAVLGDGEDHGTKDPCNTRSNDPSRKHLRDAFPPPNDSISAESSDTHTDDGSYNTMSVVCQRNLRVSGKEAYVVETGRPILVAIVR